MKKEKTDYEILGVSTDASREEITKAYHRLARQTHPDRNKEKGAEERFKKINNAYKRLMDSQEEAPTHTERASKQPADEAQQHILNLLLSETSNEEDLKFVQACGGMQALKQAVNESTHKRGSVPFAANAFALNEHGLLTPDNFKIIIECPYLSADALIALHHQRLLTPDDIKTINKCPLLSSNVLIALAKANLLTADNINLLSRLKWRPPEFAQGWNMVESPGIDIESGIRRLGEKKLLTQHRLDNLARLVLDDPRTKHVIDVLLMFNNHGILELKELERFVFEKRVSWNLNNVQASLDTLFQQPNLTTWLHQSLPENYDQLQTQLHQLLAYGIFLCNFVPKEGEEVIRLTLTLKNDMYQLSQLRADDNERRVALQQQLKQHFQEAKKGLSTHRAFWKIALANLLIACTGLGLLALGIHYTRHKQCFFNHTTRQKYLAAIEKELPLGAVPSPRDS